MIKHSHCTLFNQAKAIFYAHNERLHAYKHLCLHTYTSTNISKRCQQVCMITNKTIHEANLFAQQIYVQQQRGQCNLFIRTVFAVVGNKLVLEVFLFETSV